MGGRRAFALVFVAIVVALMVAALGPGLQGLSPTSPLPSRPPFSHVLQGQHLLITDRGHRVIRTPEAWGSFWAEGGLPGDPPSVDFGSTTVVVVLMGQRPTGGFEIRVTSVVRIGPEVLLGLVQSSPGTSCAMPPGVTQPFDIVAYPTGGSEVIPLYRSEATPC